MDWCVWLLCALSFFLKKKFYPRGVLEVLM